MEAGVEKGSGLRGYQGLTGFGVRGCRVEDLVVVFGESTHLTSPSSASLGLNDFLHAGMLGVWYKSANLGAGKCPGSPHW